MKALMPLLPIPLLMAVYSAACTGPDDSQRSRYGLCAFCAGVICLLIVWCIARAAGEEE